MGNHHLLKGTGKMRLVTGDLVKLKPCVYTVMWYPDMIGSLALVTQACYIGKYDPGDRDWLKVHLIGSHEHVPNAWAANLWELVEPGSAHSQATGRTT
jgi:hypothetical protein